MEALVYTATQKTEFRDESETQPEQGQCIIDVSHCGICGSDMHAWHGLDERRIPPLILGHEAVGVARDGPMAGQRVAINPLISCGRCEACSSGYEHLCPKRELIGMRLPGAFAQAVAISPENLTPLPDELSFQDAALAEPLAVAVHAVELAMERATKPATENKVVILGGGAIGLLIAKVLESKGIHQTAIAETNPLRTKTLNSLLVCDCYNPISQKPPFESIDIVLDAVGTGGTRAAASQLVRPGGVIIHVGLQDSLEGLDTRRITLQEIAFIGAYCYSRKDFSAAIDLLHKRQVTSQDWCDIRPLREGGSGFQDIHDGKALPKIILEI